MQNLSSSPRPLGIGELLDRAFRLYRQKFGLLFLTAAILLVPFSIISGLLTGPAMVSYFDTIENIATNASGPVQNETFGPMVNFFGTLLVVGLLGLLFFGVTTLALTRQEIGLLNDEQMGVGQGLRAGLDRLLAYVGIVLVQGLTFIAAFCGIAIVLGLGTAAFFAVVGNSTIAFGEESVPFLLNPITALICLYPLMVLLALIPILYFTARWSVAVPALMDQKLGPIGALKYSWNLTKGHGRRSIIYIVLLYMLSAVLVTVPAMVISQLAGFFMGITENIAMIQSLSIFVSLLCNVIWLPLYTAAFVMFYFDLRVRKQDYDTPQGLKPFEFKSEPATSLGNTFS